MKTLGIILLVFIATFVQSYIGTKEVHSISRTEPRKAATWAALNEGASYAVTVAIVVTDNRLLLLLPCILGNTIATYLALRKKDDSSQEVSRPAG